jgi:hypothetical protein
MNGGSNLYHGTPENPRICLSWIPGDSEAIRVFSDS